MVARALVPERGDIVWLTFDPQAGREQAGRRPALILSPSTYNRRSSLAVVCPITSQVKGYPFEVLLPDGLPISGAVLSDQLKSVDWQKRRAERAGRLSANVLTEVLERVAVLLGF